ncbi:dihydroorotase [Pleurocapsales cyanobacterium LEGE 10410]|nr:dihydroorotase [Pleurocapsales cyanobacterium LEGE 10410]
MELLRQVRVIDPVQKIDRLADVSIAEGKIQAIADQITDYPAQTQIISGAGLVLGTGLVDLYSHSGEPGNEARETLLDLAQAAAAGGFTQVGILPDTVPSIDNAEILAALNQKSQSLIAKGLDISLPDLNFWGASYNSNNRQLNELGELKADVIGFTGNYSLGNLNILRQVLEYVQSWQKTVAIALNQNELTGSGVVREGKTSIRFGMSGNPGFSEAAIIAAVLEIVAEIPTNVHIMRVSTKRGVELIADAKARGIRVTASTTWMHLLWDSEAIASYEPNLRLEPPLGESADQAALIDGVKQGIIDAIAIDHQAYTYEEKTVPFALAPPGVIGLELALPLLWQRFVNTKEWSALELWQALSHGPGQCLQQSAKAIAPEQAAELVLFDPQTTWSVNRNNLKSPAANTPWYEQQIPGQVIKIWNGN